MTAQTLSLSVFLTLALLILLNAGFEKDIERKRLQKRHLKQQRAQILGTSSSKFRQYISREQHLVNATKTDRGTYLALLAASVLLGWLFGKLVFTDTMLAFCISGACILLPHAYLVVKTNRNRRALAEELESAMRIITHEYLSTFDIQKAVENSIDLIEHKEPFQRFLVDSAVVSSSVERNLRLLELKEHNVFFSRWIDQLILTQNDRTQIVNLMPILDDMNDAKTAQHQNDTKVSSAWRDYFTLLFIILLSPLLIRFIQYEWYMYLVTTTVGKLLVMLLMASLIWATGRAMKINTPITG